MRFRFTESNTTTKSTLKVASDPKGKHALGIALRFQRCRVIMGSISLAVTRAMFSNPVLRGMDEPLRAVTSP